MSRNGKPLPVRTGERAAEIATEGPFFIFDTASCRSTFLTQPRSDPTAAILDISVLVFREGLECILVLSAVLAGMVESTAIYRRPVSAGTTAAAAATLITWRIAEYYYL